MIPITARAVRNASALTLIALFAVAIPAVAASGDDPSATGTAAPAVAEGVPSGVVCTAVAPAAGEKGAPAVIAGRGPVPPGHPTAKELAGMAAATDALDAFLTSKDIDHTVQKGPDGVRAVLLENPSAADQAVLEEYMKSHEGVPVAIAMTEGPGTAPPPLPILPARPLPSGG